MATPTLERASAPEHLGVEASLEAAHRRPSEPPRRLLRLRRPGRRTVLELAGFAILAIAYNVIRSGGGEGSAAVAVAHARDIIAIEGWVFTNLEVPLNEWMVGVTPVAVIACYLYALLHYAATPIVFFMSRRRGGWQYWRGYWALVLASAIALVVYALYPAAPPRLTPDLGIVDVMSHFSEYGWWGSAASAPRGIGDATNQYAAMPSMHFGWALWCAIQLWGFRRRIWRVLAVVYPTVLLVVVIGTGNHYLLDVVAGGAVVVAAYGIVEVIGRVTGRRRAVAASIEPDPAPQDGQLVNAVATPRVG